MNSETRFHDARRLPAGLPSLLRRLVLGAALLPIAFASTGAAHADDRDVLRDAAARPYVFIILDTSGSMNWAPKCTQAQFDAGICDYVCTTGDCAVPRNGDDPASKFRQAKEALYEVIRQVPDVDFGFGTYNQDDLDVSNKHWLYRVRSGEPQITLAGGFRWPAYGSEEVFGVTQTCDQGNNDANIGCYANNDYAADTSDTWEITRVRRLPKLNTDGATAVSFYIRSGGSVYYVTYDDPAAAQTFANTTPPVTNSTLTVRIRVDRCTGSPAANPSNNCDAAGERTLVGTVDVKYDVIGDFVQYDYRVSRTVNPGSQSDGWYGLQDSSVSNTCAGLDPNTDSGSDDNGSSYNLKQTTVNDPVVPERHPTIFDYGDVIPFDWTQDNRTLIMNRLAARLNGGDPTTDPEAFGNATYLNNLRLAGQSYLRLKNGSQRSLFPNGSTPLGASLTSFRTWYKGCASGSCSGNTGFDDIASVNDPKWACKQKFVLLITDGDETCSGNPCTLATRLFNDGVKTFVVAYGVNSQTSNSLNCIAANGGTEDPIYPQNKQELVDALTRIFGNIREQASAFASAAVPQVQANATDKIFLSSFTPLNDASYWAGRLDGFLKPLPLDTQGQPDRSIPCSSSRQSQCFLWDAGDVQAGLPDGTGTYNPERLLLQAPDSTELAATPPWDVTDLQLGSGGDQRRVFYSRFGVTGNRLLFQYPSSNSDKYDLWNGLGLSYIVGNSASETAANNAANAVIATTLVEKEGTVDTVDPSNPSNTIQTPITYLMGDIFHADPVVVGPPSDFGYYSSDPYLNKDLCGQPADPSRYPPTSYRWFADRNFCRRSLMVTSANDGQLHAFDAGIFGPAAGGNAECLLPAKDLDGDGVSEIDEWNDGVLDYDLDDDIEGYKVCSSDSDCGTGPCVGNVCRDVKVGIVEGAYSNGSGREVFSFIPRAMLPTVRKMAEGADRNRDFWGLDGSPRVDDVFIGPLDGSGNPVCMQREWRTVLISGYREGGPGFFALDVTQPDILDADHVPQPNGTPSYVPSCLGGGSACGNQVYPAVLWEFDDKASVQVGSGIYVTASLDEDLNDAPDLANSWSRPATGRIRVCTGGCTADETEDRFVAVVGGGVGDTPAAGSGNFLYMIDVETGRTLYKKAVVGGVPSDVAALDTNGDGYIDRLYAGTTSGFVYKVSLETNSSTPMRLANQTVQTRIAGTNYNHTVLRLIGPSGETKRYDPFQLFSTGGRPIYQEITSVFVTEKNRIAMAFGTGNRWNLWDLSGQEGRFYVLLDDNFADPDHDGVLNVTCSGCTQPLTESKYTQIDPEAAFDATSPTYYLYNGGGGGTLPGWYFTLEANQKVITEAFSLSGVTIFTVFDPTESTNNDGTCSRAGESLVYIVGTVTALGYAIPPGGTIADRSRYFSIPQFTTPPFVEQSATSNPEAGGSGTNHADFITESLATIRDELKSLQSTRCKYANYSQNIKTIRSDTGVVFVAPIPLCLDPISWKEF